MRIRKALSFILAAALLLGLCAGCGKSAESLHDDATQARDSAAENESAQALIALGSIYAYDDGADQAKAKAEKLYDPANAYVMGDGVDQDYQKALEYYTEAAEALERLGQPNP